MKIELLKENGTLSEILGISPERKELINTTFRDEWIDGTTSFDVINMLNNLDLSPVVWCIIFYTLGKNAYEFGLTSQNQTND